VKRSALACIALAPWAACGFHSTGVCLSSTALTSNRKTTRCLTSNEPLDSSTDALLRAVLAGQKGVAEGQIGSRTAGKDREDGVKK
jgi:hypothetical protein